ncbi:MAG: metal-dependent transcriptional regulator [Anaerolineae bacterium]|nr:metal-dependent transcriptional regulator [Anaerolineae bacterium]
MDDDLSAKMRHYLADIYRLHDMEQPDSGYVNTSTLADLLFVSAPAVNRMVNRLKELDMLEHEPYKGIRLTQKGMQVALKQLRTHRITECFLMVVMGLSWEDVYQEATNVSQALNDTILARMTVMAGQPSFCPHGEPIPKPDGTIEALDDQRLSAIETEQRVVVTRMLTRESDRLAYIQALGLMPGTELDVIHRAPFNGPMQLKVDKEYRIIGHNLAALIRAKPLKTT